MVLELIDLVGKASEEVTVVGYDDECSFEALECLLENVLGGDVQVVGRLVHHQYVKGGEEHFGQSQAIAFAPWEYFYFLFYLIATEEESTEYITYFDTVGVIGCIEHGIQEGEFAVQVMGLVLSEVAYFYIVPQADRTLIGNLSYNHLGQGCFPLSVLSDESYLGATFY